MIRFSLATTAQSIHSCIRTHVFNFIITLTKSPFRFAANEPELNEMIRDLYEKAKEIRLELNLSKTKYMTNQQINKNHIEIDSLKIEKIESYVYLGGKL